MTSLDGKVAIVTGAGQGIGRGIALALAGAGARVVVAGRTPEKLDSVVETITERGGTAHSIVIDVTADGMEDTLVAETVRRFGTIDILVNNAQVVPMGKLLDVSDRAFEAGFRSGPHATLRLMRACHPHLRGDGVIINLGSGTGLKWDPIGEGCYGAVKEAIRTLTRTAAVEWGPDGIRAHVIVPVGNSPGMVGWEQNFPEDAARFKASIPLGRIGDCEVDVGRVAVFLCSPDAQYMTGGTLLVDGGQAYLH